MSYTIAWFIAFLVLLFIEVITINLVTIWFAVGALAAFITSLITESFIIQMIVFLVVSVIALLITKPLIKKFKGFQVTPTNFDRVIGQEGEVTKKISKNEYGEVKVFGNTWTAYSKQTIKEGEKVKVLDIEGVKLIVEKEEK